MKTNAFPSVLFPFLSLATPLLAEEKWWIGDDGDAYKEFPFSGSACTEKP